MKNNVLMMDMKNIVLKQMKKLEKKDQKYRKEFMMIKNTSKQIILQKFYKIKVVYIKLKQIQQNLD